MITSYFKIEILAKRSHLADERKRFIRSLTLIVFIIFTNVFLFFSTIFLFLLKYFLLIRTKYQTWQERRTLIEDCFYWENSNSILFNSNLQWTYIEYELSPEIAINLIKTLIRAVYRWRELECPLLHPISTNKFNKTPQMIFVIWLGGKGLQAPLPAILIYFSIFW